ncbi:hypothetical protein ABW19_dt0203884 [Dactylella cylindrospora]|nr:hypothetical protein ABW19_dt0203884 [Dactylella cylindrospora]
MRRHCDLLYDLNRGAGRCPFLEEARKEGEAHNQAVEQMEALPPTLQNPKYRRIPIDLMEKGNWPPFRLTIEFAIRRRPSLDYIHGVFNELEEQDKYQAKGHRKAYMMEAAFAISPGDRLISYIKQRESIPENWSGEGREMIPVEFLNPPYKYGVDREYIKAAWREGNSINFGKETFTIKYIHWPRTSERLRDVVTLLNDEHGFSPWTSIWEVTELHGEGYYDPDLGNYIPREYVKGATLSRYDHRSDHQKAFNALYSSPEAAEIEGMVRENPEVFGSGDMGIVCVTFLTIPKSEWNSVVWEIGSISAARAGRPRSRPLPWDKTYDRNGKIINKGRSEMRMYANEPEIN